MASSSSRPPLRQLAVAIPPGVPLGVTIQRQRESNQCIVAEHAAKGADNENAASPLAVGDIIVSLNGIPLDQVHGGMDAWLTLFRAFASVERTLTVLRRADGGGGGGAALVPAAAPTALVPGGGSSAIRPLPESLALIEGKTSSARASVASVLAAAKPPGEAALALPATASTALAPAAAATPVPTKPAAVKSERAVRNSTKNSSGRWSNLGKGQPREAAPEASPTQDSGAKKQKVGEQERASGAKPAATKSADATPKLAAAGGEKTNDSTKSNAASLSASSSAKRSIDVISLLDSSDDEDESSSGKPPAARSTGSGSTDSSMMEDRKMPAAGSTSTATSSDTDVFEVSDPSQWKKPDAPSSSGKSSGQEEEDEELAIVGTKGSNALADFPHARANCVSMPFAADKSAHCANCFCYVCDIPASDCKEWQSHCEASHEDRRWREERERAKRRAQEAAAAPPPAAAMASSALQVIRTRPASAAALARAARTANTRPEFSVRRLLERVTRVYPVEISPPAGSGFSTSLRHYQKQSLAFMVNTERTSGRGGWLCDEVGMGKTACVLALVAANPPSPKVLASNQQMNDAIRALDANTQKRFQIQAAYNDEVERICDLRNTFEPGTMKWQELNSELMRARRKRDDRLRTEIVPVKKVKVKTTVILTSVSLMGQWEDECQKHAPGLTIKCFHGSRKKKAATTLVLSRQTMSQLNNIDIIISSATFRWPADVTSVVDFARVVQDESHLFTNGTSARIDHANAICSPWRWGVTATPCTSSPRELVRQLEFLRGSNAIDPSNPMCRLTSEIATFTTRPSQTAFNNLIDSLQTFMVRHTKSQRIGGSAALALPPSTTSTVMLEMSADEDAEFNHINASTGTVSSHCRHGCKKFAAESIFLFRMTSGLKSKSASQLSEAVSSFGPSTKRQYIPERLTKVRALREDLARLRQTEPNLRAVVFTGYVDVHSACVRGLEKDGFEVLKFSGETGARQRDSAIRKFQNSSGNGGNRPSVFVITLRSGNVGITLTAASRVYLLEPSLDPAVEVQAAGRIHRLGQDKPCHVVKFAFKNSYEANVIKLHKKILEGKASIVDGFVPPEAMKILRKDLRIQDPRSILADDQSLLNF